MGRGAFRVKSLSWQTQGGGEIPAVVGRVRSLAFLSILPVFSHSARRADHCISRVPQSFFSILLVNVVWGETSVQDGLNILQTDQSHLNPRVQCGGAQMGEQHHLLQLSHR